jgi:hypothetical protein
VKARTRTAPRPQPAAPLLALVAVSIAGAMLAMMLISRYVWGVDLPTFFTSVREYNEAQATAQVIGPQDAHQAAPAPRYGAQPAAPVSQEGAPVTAPLVKATPAGKAEPTPAPKVAPQGKADEGQAVSVAEPPKATPGGKAEPTPAKSREGKGTP